MADEASGTGDATPGEPPKTYAVRFTPSAARELIEAGEYLERRTGDPEAALLWSLAMREAAATLSTSPRKFQVQQQVTRRVGVPGVEVRRMLFRRPPGPAAGYHLYYYIRETGEDGPTVRVFHVRHASRRPITPSEGRFLREDL